MQEVNLITSRLEQSGIVYCLVGGLAAIAYGRPRLTLDADLVVALLPSHIDPLIKAFPPEDFYLPPAEILLAEIQRESRGHFNILHQHSALRADCYLPGKSALAHWELKHRQQIESPLGTCWFSPPEAVIIHKLLFYREGRSEKHIEDIRSILETGALRDRIILEQWITDYNLNTEWQTVVRGAA